MTALQQLLTLAHCDGPKCLCAYTNALDASWSGTVTQIPPSDFRKAHSEQHHDSPGFLSGRFDRTQLGCCTLEKKAYAVLATLDRMRWLLAKQDGFNLLTDHNNLTFLLDPLSVVRALAKLPCASSPLGDSP